MALKDFLTKQFIDVIHWTESEEGVLAWRFPMRDMEIQNGAQLTVRESQMMEVARRDGAAEIARRMLPRLLGETTRRENPAVVNRVRQMVEASSPEAIVRMLKALATRPDSTPLLAAIAVPTLVLAGEEDVITPPVESSEWAAAIPGAGFRVIPRAGHLSCLEAPERFAQSLEAVLGR